MSNKKKITVLGTTGMLGSMILDFLSKEKNLEINATVRNKSVLKNFQEKYPYVNFFLLDVETIKEDEIFQIVKGSSWIINAIGVIKPYIQEDNLISTQRAICINAFFPHILAKVAEKSESSILQIATDCVYSGNQGNYTEENLHDALDIYGKTKSLGEVYSSKMHHLRCSIIGPELENHASLLDWFLGQPKSAKINGFTNHSWNGITTLHFAKICLGIIKNNPKLGSLQHIVPSDKIKKSELLRTFAKNYDRQDIIINDMVANQKIDRILLTNNREQNEMLWEMAGYDNGPISIKEMIFELANYK